MTQMWTCQGWWGWRPPKAPHLSRPPATKSNHRNPQPGKLTTVFALCISLTYQITLACCCSRVLSRRTQAPLQRKTWVPGLGSTKYLALTLPPSSSSHWVLSMGWLIVFSCPPSTVHQNRGHEEQFRFWTKFFISLIIQRCQIPPLSRIPNPT